MRFDRLLAGTRGPLIDDRSPTRISLSARLERLPKRGDVWAVALRRNAKGQHFTHAMHLVSRDPAMDRRLLGLLARWRRRPEDPTGKSTAPLARRIYALARDAILLYLEEPLDNRLVRAHAVSLCRAPEGPHAWRCSDILLGAADDTIHLTEVRPLRGLKWPATHRARLLGLKGSRTLLRVGLADPTTLHQVGYAGAVPLAVDAQKRLKVTARAKALLNARTALLMAMVRLASGDHLKYVWVVKRLEKTRPRRPSGQVSPSPRTP